MGNSHFGAAMANAGTPSIALQPGEIRASLLAVRKLASESLRERELMKRVDDALGLLAQAIEHRGDVEAIARQRRAPIAQRIQLGLARRMRELRRPGRALCHPNARWELVSVAVAVLLSGSAWFAYVANVEDYDQLRNVSDFLQGAEGFLTVLVIIAAWSYSTWRIERERRIERAIAAVDECRALILIIDAHSIAKDFSRYWDPRRSASPGIVDGLRREDAIEYLAVGTRITNLTAQIAACYGSMIQDHAVIAAIDSVSQLALAVERNGLAKQQMIARGFEAGR